MDIYSSFYHALDMYRDETTKTENIAFLRLKEENTFKMTVSFILDWN